MLTTTKKMSPERNNLLIACFHQMEEVKNRKLPSDAEDWEIAEFEQQVMFGPLYMPSMWFRYTPPNLRKKYAREIFRMRDEGLLLVHNDDNRLSNIKLTEKGERLAKKRIALSSQPLAEVR